MIARENLLCLLADQMQQSCNVEAMAHGRVGREIFFRQSKQTYGGMQSSPILGMIWARVVFLQMHKAARGLNQAFEIIGIVRLRPQPKMLEHIMRFVIALLVPTAEESDITGMFRDVVRIKAGPPATQLRYEFGNSLAFVHEKLSFVVAEMTGNPARFLFLRESCGAAAGRG